MYKKIKQHQRMLMIIIASVCGALIMGGLVWVNFRPQTESHSTKSYRVYKVKKQANLQFKGQVSPANEDLYRLDVSKGQLDEILVKDGDSVKVGDPLYTYKNTDMATNLDKSEAELAQLSQELEFAKSDQSLLVSKQTEAKQQEGQLTSHIEALTRQMAAAKPTDDISQVQLAMETAKGELAEVKAKLEGFNQEEVTTKRAVTRAQQSLESGQKSHQQLQEKLTGQETAKTAGIVHLDKDAKLSPESAILKILSQSTKVLGEVSEFDYHALEINQPVMLQTATNNQAFTGKITALSDLPVYKSGKTAGSVSNYQFEVSVDGSLQYGFNVEIVLDRKGLSIPVKAVFKSGDTDYVHLYDEQAGTVKKVPVYGKKEGQVYIVARGLEQDQKIIDQADRTLKDGQEVRV